MTASEAAFLSLRGLSRSFGALKAVDGVDLDIPEGEFLTIVGPSGSGKSTLVRMLAGLDRPDRGDILLRGVSITDVPANRRPSCMVFQSLGLFNHKTVGDNIAFALKMRGVDRATRRARAQELMRLVRLPTDYQDRQVTQCSGGERQRVALARALASDPEILFFDEPLSAIDYRLRKILEMEMKDLHRETGKTFIYITHSLEEAMVMSDRVAIMRSGRLVQIGPPLEIYQRPRSRFVAAFMGEVNILTIEPREDRLVLAELGVAMPAGPRDEREGGYLVLRPEHLRLLEDGEPAPVAFEAEIFNDYILGSRTQFHARVAGHTLVGEVAALGGRQPKPGTRSRLGFDPAHAVVVEA
ncbi:MAG: ABC transporter ATP-binding protein [Pseudomonadota bacterium]